MVSLLRRSSLWVLLVMLIPAAAALPCLASPGSLTVEDDSGELCLSATVQAGMDPVDQRLACYNPDEGAERDVLDEVPRGTIPLVPTPDDPPIVPGSLDVYDQDGEFCLAATAQTYGGPMQQPLACYNPGSEAERELLAFVPRGSIPLVPSTDHLAIVPGSLDVYDQDGEFCLAATAQTYGGPMQQPLACYNPGSDTERDLLAQVPHGSIPLGAPPAP